MSKIQPIPASRRKLLEKVVTTYDESQKKTIGQVLLMHESGLTSVEALHDYGVGRLAAVVFLLREAGWPIVTVKVSGTNRHSGKPTTFARYRLGVEAA